MQHVLDEEASKKRYSAMCGTASARGPEGYNGPLKMAVEVFGRTLERMSVHPLHYKPGVVLCSLELKDKFVLFVRDHLDPVTFLSSGLWAVCLHGRRRRRLNRATHPNSEAGLAMAHRIRLIGKWRELVYTRPGLCQIPIAVQAARKQMH